MRYVFGGGLMVLGVLAGVTGGNGIVFWLVGILTMAMMD